MCQGCLDDTLVFENGAARRRQLNKHTRTPLASINRRLQATFSIAGECLCAVDVDEDNVRPPTRKEFTFAFNETVAELIVTDTVALITKVDTTSEVEKFFCEATSETPRFSQLMMQAEGDAKDVSTSDSTSLERIVRRSLDDLYAQSCDPEFRSIVTVTSDGFESLCTKTNSLGSHRQLQFGGGNDDPQLLPFFNVVFQCRGCSDGALIFANDDARRQLNPFAISTLPSKFVGQSPRRLQGSDTCFYDVNAVTDTQAPAVEEFETMFIEAQTLTNDADVTITRQVKWFVIVAWDMPDWIVLSSTSALKKQVLVIFQVVTASIVLLTRACMNVVAKQTMVG